jgi:Arc/MetJ-type ribon-helix-helix transcriptional regulator
MKVSVSLPDDEVAFLDSYAKSQGIASRSAVLLKAIRCLRNLGLERAYTEAWSEWETSGESQAWDQAAGDGLTHAPW